MQVIELIVVGIGIIAGTLAGWLWPITSARLGDNDFWPRLNELSKLLLSDGAEDQFLRQYLQMLPVLARYSAKKFAVLVLAFAPVMIVFVALTPYANSEWYKHATHIEVTPTQQLTISIEGQQWQLGRTNDLSFDSLELDSRVSLSLEGGDFDCKTLMRKQAYSPHHIQTFGLLALGFKGLEPIRIDEADEAWPILVQLSSGDNNILWPYLNDWEFDYLLAVSLASVACMLVLRRPKC